MSVDRLTAGHLSDQPGNEGANPVSTLQISDLTFEPCSKTEAIAFNLQHHSRLPKIANIGIKYAFHARCGDSVYITALWSNPVARLLPQHWLELRRMACSPDVPKNAASAFLSWMVRWIRKHHPEHEKLISYQDCDVHKGTIYKASGWVVGNVTKGQAHWTERKSKKGKQSNGAAVMASPKVRWELKL